MRVCVCVCVFLDDFLMVFNRFVNDFCDDVALIFHRNSLLRKLGLFILGCFEILFAAG